MGTLPKTYTSSYWKICNMKEIATRSLSGAVYVALLLVASYTSATTFLGVFFIFGLITLYEFQKLIHLKSSILYLLYITMMIVFSYSTIPTYITSSLLVLTIATQLFLIKDLLSTTHGKISVMKKYGISIGYLINAFLFLTLLPNYTGQYQPHLITGTFFLIWTNDSFAFLVGRSIGKHKLLERISPKKTLEGFIGGVVFSMLASTIIYNFTNTLSPVNWLLMSLIISIFGTLGDLIQSKFKRQAGVKDSGTIMPGHGGIYDRLDSMIFAAPFLYAFLYLLHYVS